MDGMILGAADGPAPGLIALVQQEAQHFAALLRAAPGARTVPTRDWLALARDTGALRRPLAWQNTVIRTRALRRAHVEYFAIPGEIAVLHVCAFPVLGLGLPIFGFDLVAGRAKATGCFIDLSPTVPQAAPLLAAWAAGQPADPPGERRVLPGWGSIFSAHMLALRPRDAGEVASGFALGRAALELLLGWPGVPADPHAMRAAQLDYVAGQRRNERTRRMLAGCVGERLADRFIARCLFPPPPRLRPAGRDRHANASFSIGCHTEPAAACRAD